MSQTPEKNQRHGLPTPGMPSSRAPAYSACSVQSVAPWPVPAWFLPACSGLAGVVAASVDLIAIAASPRFHAATFPLA